MKFPRSEKENHSARSEKYALVLHAVRLVRKSACSLRMYCLAATHHLGFILCRHTDSLCKGFTGEAQYAQAACIMPGGRARLPN